MEPLNENIDSLIADKLSGQITPEDDALLLQLISTNEEVRVQWEDSLAVVSFYNANRKAAIIDEDAAWNKIASPLKEPQVVKLRPNKFKWLVAAGVLVPLMLIGLWFGLSKSNLHFAQNKATETEEIKVTLSDGTTYLVQKGEGITAGQIHFGAKSANRLSKKNSGALVNQVVTLEIPKGKTYAIVLEDGTSVKINSASVLKFPLVFTGNKREVELDGEAYFEVTKNSKPFVVKTQEMDVKVLGTKFNVNTYPGNAAQTSLVEGSVAVSSANHPTDLLIKPGQAVVKRANNNMVVESFSSESVLSWLNGAYYFANMPLREIVNIANRVTGEDLYITDSKIANYRFSGALETSKPITVLLDNIKSSSSAVQYTIKNGRIELHK